MIMKLIMNLTQLRNISVLFVYHSSHKKMGAKHLVLFDSIMLPTTCIYHIPCLHLKSLGLVSSHVFQCTSTQTNYIIKAFFH